MDRIRQLFSTGSGAPPGEIKVHPDTHNPTIAWDKLSVKQTVIVKKPLRTNTPVNPKKMRFVCISDTHSRTDMLQPDFIPDGDVLLHAGDFTNIGKVKEFEHFNNFLGTLPHRRKIVIAGNHEMMLDENVLSEKNDNLSLLYDKGAEEARDYLLTNGAKDLSHILTNCIFLHDSGVDVCGIRIYGSPWQPWFGGWAFNLERGQECLDKWNLIPNGMDILMTHGPPIGHGDLCGGLQRAGCVELLSTIQKRVKPKYHVFGHIHEGYGITTDGYTEYINASTCTRNYKPCNSPIIFDIPLPVGRSKDEPVVLFSSLEKEDKSELSQDSENAESQRLIISDHAESNML